MKRITFSLFIFSFLLISCHNTFIDVDNNLNDTKTKTVTFTFGGFTMSGLDGINSEESHESRASNVQANYTDHLILGIYDANGSIVDSLIYQNKDDNQTSYGTFTHNLVYGKYTVLAIGWNGEQQCLVHSLDSISFSQNWVPNTFLCREEIVVNDNQSSSHPLTLKRCVSKFSVVFKDKNAPCDINHFTIAFSGAGNTINSKTLHCTHTQDFSRTLLVETDPSKITSISTYCVLPKDSAGININVAAFDSNGNTVSQKYFENVPMKINYVTKYSGNFYTTYSGTEEILFEIDFDGEINVDF